MVVQEVAGWPEQKPDGPLLEALKVCGNVDAPSRGPWRLNEAVVQEGVPHYHSCGLHVAALRRH